MYFASGVTPIICCRKRGEGQTQAEERPRDLDSRIVYAFCLLLMNDAPSFRHQVGSCLELPTLERQQKTVLLFLGAGVSLQMGEFHASIDRYYSRT